MKLVTFRQSNQTEPIFGIIIEQRVFSFQTLQRLARRTLPSLETMMSYLQGLPKSEEEARQLLAFALAHLSEFEEGDSFAITDVQLLPPVPAPPAVLDFGLSPRHLLNSGLTLVGREFKGPLQWLLRQLLRRVFKKAASKLDFPYYKSNHQALSGPSDTLLWPPYTSYLDVEPELAVVVGQTQTDPQTGQRSASIAGYMIMNDVSARDVQFPDFRTLCGPARSKDFDRSIGLGPYLVTADEISDPLALNVKVQIGDRLRWQGSTAEYIAHPQQVVDTVCSIFTPTPGTILGMGTIPDCCGLDRDEWLMPGERVEITIAGLGSLVQHVPEQLPPLQPSRWQERVELLPFINHGGSGGRI